MRCMDFFITQLYRDTSLTRKYNPLGPYHRPMPRFLGGFYEGGHFLMCEAPLQVHGLFNHSALGTRVFQDVHRESYRRNRTSLGGGGGAPAGSGGRSCWSQRGPRVAFQDPSKTFYHLYNILKVSKPPSSQVEIGFTANALPGGFGGRSCWSQQGPRVASRGLSLFSSPAAPASPTGSVNVTRNDDLA